MMRRRNGAGEIRLLVLASRIHGNGGIAARDATVPGKLGYDHWIPAFAGMTVMRRGRNFAG